MGVLSVMCFYFVFNVLYTVCKENEYKFIQVVFTKGQKPKFICEINQDANYLLRNHIKWERISMNSKREVLSTLANVPNELETNYSVDIQSSRSGVQFHLKFLQELDGDFGFLQCVLYNSDHDILQIRQLGIFAESTERKKGDRLIEQYEFQAHQEMIHDSPGEENITESSIQLHVFPDKSDMTYDTVTTTKGTQPRITKQLIPFISISNKPKQFDVHFIAYPSPVVIWYKACSTAKPVRLFNHITSATRSFIILSSIYPEYAGCTICVRIQNMYGYIESYTVLLNSNDEFKSSGVS
ncbi:uncharacterized protein LOC127717590 isoform X2 [Mytilus californianus]|uniref:uncharacterized protein LOC127717590 isoform X1 n=1 Tax=Mytilus californianus TaxID=6549 RepID=UPI0022456080|nr:uncharacterized protein LOC127717590 isoform X1 [Mytilus californianus]XP_052079259.1 uncharacterized protein LOC127717590 isoform X2 [Mytilus californianus]